ncbi:MAG TPA: sodium:solute symporter [Armatimonadota bacterium]|jgi:SSS family transporter
MQMTYAIIVVLYVLVMLAIGYWCMRRTKSVGDFFLGGRTLGPWMSAFAFGTTYFSSVIFIGYAGKLGWGFGIHTMWIVVGNTLIGTILAWKLLAGRTREMTARLNAITMPEFLAARYGDKGLQVISALVIFIFLVPYSASVLMGLSYLFGMTIHIPYDTALYFLTALTALYLVMGGYFAVAVSDFVRGIVEFAGVLLMVYLLAHRHGGFAETSARLLSDPSMAPGLQKITHLGPVGMQFPVSGVVIFTSLVLITSFGPWALPQMVQKFYSIRSKADVTRAMIIAGLFSFFMAFGAYYSGALTHLFYTMQKGSFFLLSNPTTAAIPVGPKGPEWDQLMPHFITNSGLPVALIIVVVLMVFSASMSSLSSLVLVSSSAIAVDVYGAFVNRHANQKQTMTLLRVFCVLFVGASLLIALMRPAFIVNLMVIAWGTLAGVFLAPYLYGLFWKRTTRAGVYAGVFTGLTSAVTLFLLWGQDGVPLAGAITMFLPLIVVPLVSILTAPPSAEIIAKAFTETEDETPSVREEVVA